MVDWKRIGRKLGYDLRGVASRGEKRTPGGALGSRREDTIVEGLDVIRSGVGGDAITVAEGVKFDKEKLKAKELEQMELDFKRFLQGGEINYIDWIKLSDILKKKLEGDLKLSGREIYSLLMGLVIVPKRSKEEEDYVQMMQSLPINVEEFQKLWDRIGANISTKRALMDCVKATINWIDERDQRKLEGELRK